jgi:hypothetical protein
MWHGRVPSVGVRPGSGSNSNSRFPSGMTTREAKEILRWSTPTLQALAQNAILSMARALSVGQRTVGMYLSIPETEMSGLR